MSLRGFLTRNGTPEDSAKLSETISNDVKNSIICETAKLEEQIRKWTENEGWRFEDFATFVELIGIKTPTKLTDWNSKDHSFKCITALNTEVIIKLRFGSIDFPTEISITEGNETRCYTINTKFDESSKPNVTLSRRVLKKDGKELQSYYSEFFCQRELKFDDTYSLKFNIKEPNIGADNKSDIAVLRNYGDVEEYLINLRKQFEVSEVWNRLKELLGFSEEEISGSAMISITYLETIEKEENVRSRICLNNGVMVEYAILEGKETFYVMKSGDWKYLSDDGIKIDYIHESKIISFSMKGKENKIREINHSELLQRVEKKISELMRFVR